MSTPNTHFFGKININLGLSGVPKAIVFVIGLMLTATLISCGGGADTRDTTGINNEGGGGNVDTSASNSTADMRSFKLNVWDNLFQNNKCGQCHGIGQTPKFVDLNVAVAYTEAITVTDLTNPANSRLVTKVAGGHNCWLPTDAECGTAITGYIDAWINGTVASPGREIQLDPPVIKDPGTSKNFPASPTDANADFTALHTLLRDTDTANCVACHDESSATPQAPYFASADINTAYEAAKLKIDINNPANSRLVIRLSEESHNCWSDCGSDATTMLNAITNYAQNIPLNAVNPQWVISKALTLDDAIVASGGDRHEANLIAGWEFKEGTGIEAKDTSGVISVSGQTTGPLNLTLSGNVTWVGGYGVNIGSGGRLQGTTAASKKLYDFIKASEEYTIEAWVVPANVVQEDTSIASYGASANNSNMMLGQTMYNYDFFNRSDFTVANNNNVMSTPDADEVLQASLQHVVVTYSPLYPAADAPPLYGRRIYVNGQLTGAVDAVAAIGDTLGNLWDEISVLSLGNSADGGRQWEGRIRQLAIHNRALTPEQITQNFDVGVGQKYFMLFSVADRLSIPDTYVLFEVSQYDDYSYFFNKPTFISLDGSWTPSSPITVQGMRIGINGGIADVGQAYANMDVTIDSNSYADSKQVMSNLGTIIALENGQSSDEFFLAFERLGTDSFTFVEPTVPPYVDPGTSADPVSDIGLRTFDEINQTMSDLTGITMTPGSAVHDVYATYRQQLPAVESIDTFVSANQMAIAQLSMAYCNQLVSTNQAFFTAGGFSFSNSAGTAFDTAAERDSVINPLLTTMMNMEAVNDANGLNLTSQPTDADIRQQLGSFTTLQYTGGTTENYESLITQLTQCATGGSPTCNTTARTQEVVISTCAAVLGSSIMLVQ